MNDALLPCPFCGEKAVYEPDYSSSHDFVKLVAVGCEGSDCNNYQCARTKDKAIERWNRRSPTPKLELPQEVREALAFYAKGQSYVGHSTEAVHGRALASFIRRIAGEESRG
jgi:Lar family restriction alleviation protein